MQHKPLVTLTFTMHNNLIISWHSWIVTQANCGVSCASFKHNCHKHVLFYYKQSIIQN